MHAPLSGGLVGGQTGGTEDRSARAKTAARLHLLLEKAKAGDVLAIKLVAERVCPPLKLAEPLAEFALQGETMAQKALGIVAARASGAVPLAQASSMLEGLATLAKIVDTEELKQRLQAVEKLLKEQGHGRT
jgi:hypothetical protein